MSFGFGVGDFLAVAKLVRKIRIDFADAPKQFGDLSTEVRSLSIVLQDIEIFISSDQVSDAQRRKLGVILVGCKQTLEDTNDTLAKYCVLGTKGNGIGETARRSWKRLTLEPNDIRDLRSRVSSNTTLLNSFISSLTRDNVTVTRLHVTKLLKGQDQHQHQEILNWLTPIDYATQQRDYFNRRQEGTGQWLLSSSEYRQWVEGAKQLLFCPGIPGAGKTILTSVVVDDLLERFSADESIAICYIYCNFRRKEEQKFDDLLASLLKQLVQGHPQFPQCVADLYERHKRLRTRPSTEDIHKALQSVTADYSRVFVAVDALDEISYGCRSQFIPGLLGLHDQIGANLLATSRFIPEITERFHGYACKDIRATSDDVARYLKGHMKPLPRFVSANSQLQDEITKKIGEASDGMFLLAQLHLEALKGKRSPKALRNALTKLATGSDAYDVTYKAAMERIKSQLPDQTELAFQALSWITNAKRPLNMTELQHALGVELDTPTFDEENLPDLHDVVSYCEGLVTMDENTRIVRLVHYTTQEYFERTKGTWFPESQTDIARICIHYLSFDGFKVGMCGTLKKLGDRFLKYPLYDYACRYWGTHGDLPPSYRWENTFLGVQAQFEAAAEGFLISQKEVDSMAHLINDCKCFRRGLPLCSTALQLSAKFGNESAAAFCLQYQDVTKDLSSGAPLRLAIQEGHENVVRLLFEAMAVANP